MTRRQHSQSELQQAYEHIRYEVEMLISTANLLASGSPGEGPARNATLESFVIHTRNMLDFLYGDNSRKSDMTAVDFVAAGIWHRERPIKSKLLCKAHQRAHKEIAHLTYNRLGITPEAKQWPFVEIAREVERAFGIFASLAKWNPNTGTVTAEPKIVQACSSTAVTFIVGPFSYQSPPDSDKPRR